MLTEFSKCFYVGRFFLRWLFCVFAAALLVPLSAFAATLSFEFKVQSANAVVSVLLGDVAKITRSWDTNSGVVLSDNPPEPSNGAVDGGYFAAIRTLVEGT